MVNGFERVKNIYVFENCLKDQKFRDNLKAKCS